MSFMSALRVALGALLVNKGRSILTSLGIVIGISAVIAMVSAGSGARFKLDERLSNVGKNLILIRSGARNQQNFNMGGKPVTSDDAAAVRQKCSHLLTGVAESQMLPVMASTKIGNHGCVMVGSVPDLKIIRNWSVQYGRFYNDDDVKSLAPVCLIGQTTRRKLFPDTPDPVGDWVRITSQSGQIRLRIIGVLGEKGRSPTGADQDDQIFVPITTMQRRLVGREELAVIVAAARDDKDLEKAKNAIIEVLRERHHIKPGEQADFDVSTVREMAQVAEILATTMQFLIATIASISLVVGGIGIMNIMLVSVTERTREIGIRMAVGATSFDVLIQFLIEAVVLALVGGVIGITLGIVGAFGLSRLGEWPLVVQPEIVLLAFFVAAAVGVFFGYYPALRASRLDPIDALRYE